MARPAAAEFPCKGATDHGQSPLQGQPPAGMVGAYRGDACGRRQHSRPGRRGRSLLRGQRPRKAALPTSEVPPEGSNAAAYAGQRRRSDVKGEG
ncbi:hypothetical protein GW17_00022678 [Ensete ventricosum]|nr:hypothetical protein GW17_00022678 [Ensete ventricosum]